MSDFGFGLLDDKPGQPPAPANPYGFDALDPLPQANAHLMGAMGKSPDEQAKALSISKQTGVPFPSVEADTAHWGAQAQLAKNQVALEQNPKTAQWVANNPLAARLAQDDLDNLTAIERAIQVLGKGADLATSGVRSLASGLPTASAGLWGAAAAPFELVGLDTIGGFLRNEQKAAQAQAARWQGMDPDAGVIERGVMGGLQSAGQNLALLPAGLANGVRLSGEQLMLGMMGLVTAGQSYGKGRDAGLSPARAIPYAVEDATAEIVTEKYLGAAGFLRNIKAGASSAKLFAYELTREVPGEMAATLWQNFNEWANVNPEKSVADWVLEQPEAQAETIIATLVGGGAQIGTVKAAQRIMGAGVQRETQAAQSEQTAQVLAQLNQLAAASKVRGRDTESFQSFIREATEDGPVPELYLDPNSLAQAGITIEELTALAPSLANQDTAAGTDLRIPTEEFAANIAGTPLADALLPHLKTDAKGMSQAEAAEYMSTQGEQLKLEVENMLSAQESSAAMRVSRDVVQDNILAQLQATKRFRDDVNKPYAALVAARYGVLAHQLGITPEEAFAKYPLKIQAQSLAGEVLNQGDILDLGDLASFGGPVGEDTSALRDNASGESAASLEAQSRLQRERDNDQRRYLIDARLGSVRPLFGVDAVDTHAGPEQIIVQKNVGAQQWTVLSHGGKVSRQTAMAAIARARGRGALFQKRRTTTLPDPSTLTMPLVPTAQQMAEKGRVEMVPLDRAVSFQSAREWDDFKAGKYRDALVEGYGDKPLAVRLETGEYVVYDGNHRTETAMQAGTDALEMYVIDAKSYDREAAGRAPAPASAIDDDDLLAQLLGQGAAPTLPTDTPEFKNWFGDSKVVDEAGKPLVVYHGTTRGGFTEFKENKRTRSGGFVFTGSRDLAATYTPNDTDIEGTEGHGGIYPVYLSIKNPKVIDWGGDHFQKDDGTSTDDAIAQAKAEGFDGVIIRNVRDNYDSMHGGRDPMSDVFVAFTSNQIKHAERNDGSFDATDPSILSQGQQGQRGAFSPDSKTITLLKGADLSTFLHETGHAFLDMQAQFASMPNAPQAIRDDMEVLLKWFGVQATPEHTALESWMLMSLDQQRESHENFARGFEAYLFTGKAPNVELQGVFGRFRSWLLNIYQSLKSLNVTLNDEVRGVMDRMLATEQEIEAMEASASMGLMFKTPEEAAKFGIDWAKYHDQGAAATEKAIDELGARRMMDLQWMENAKSAKLKELQKAAAEKRREVRGEVRPEVMSRRVYRAWQFLTGKDDAVAPGTVAVDAIDTEQSSGKLRLGALENISDEDKKRLRGLRMTSEQEGMHPDIVAELFGYSSGDELVRRIAQAPTPAQAIEAETDRVMMERYGDLNSAEALERAATEAVHNMARQRIVATELAALEGATDVRPQGKGRNTLPKAAKAFAEDLIARLKVRDIRPTQYEAAEARATRAAEKALKAGDIQKAATEKRNQLINGYATRAALEAQEDVERARAYFRRFDSDAARKSIDSSYTDQIDLLLERYEFRAVPLKALDKRTDLKAWVESQQQMGLEPEIPDALLEGIDRKNYRDMTVEELRGLVDTVKQIEHLGRLKRKLLTAKNEKEYAAARDEMVASIEAHAGDRTAVTRTANTLIGRKVQGLQRFWAAHIKAATWARVFDGGQDGGPVWEYLIRPANAAGDKEVLMRERATREITALVQPLLKQKGMHGKGELVPGVFKKGENQPGRLGSSFNREERIAIALNTGNEGNLQRLTGGENWSLDDLRKITDTLTKQEWDFVQSVWDYIESYRPEIAAKERRVYGKEPAWVKPMPVVTKHGTYKGGYYPIKYDPRASSRAEEHAEAEAIKQQLKGAYTSATTRRSFTKTRAEQVKGRPLMYSLNGLYAGLNEVIHDLAWHEFLIDANRIVKSESISGAIRERYGPDAHNQFRKWLEDVAVGNQAGAAGDQAVAWIRQGVSISGLGLNVMSALVQPFGITQSIVRVGPKWVGRGVAKFVASPIESVKEVTGKSNFMRTRNLTRMRELAEVRNRIEGQTAARRAVDSSAYWLMLRAQQMVDVPTWLGAYEKAIESGPLDEERAIALADQAVIDAQGSGTEKDQSAIERGNAALKLFTVFYSFQNTALNLGVAQTMTSKSKAKLAADYLLLYVVPVMLVAAMKDVLTPGDSGDDDWEKWAAKLAKEELGFLFGLMFMVREFSGAAQAAMGLGQAGMDYQGPSGVRMIGDIGKLAKQANQGEMDDGLRKAIVNVAGELLRLPAAQMNRSITGAEALSEGKTDNPFALVLGYEEPK